MCVIYRFSSPFINDTLSFMLYVQCTYTSYYCSTCALRLRTAFWSTCFVIFWKVNRGTPDGFTLDSNSKEQSHRGNDMKHVCMRKHTPTRTCALNIFCLLHFVVVVDSAICTIQTWIRLPLIRSKIPFIKEFNIILVFFFVILVEPAKHLHNRIGVMALHLYVHKFKTLPASPGCSKHNDFACMVA